MQNQGRSVFPKSPLPGREGEGRGIAERYVGILHEWAIISWNDISPAFLCDVQSTGGQSIATNTIHPALQVWIS